MKNPQVNGTIELRNKLHESIKADHIKRYGSLPKSGRIGIRVSYLLFDALKVRFNKG